MAKNPTDLADKLRARFRVAPSGKLRLGGRDPADRSAFPERDAAEKQTERDSIAINDLQDRLYAERARALLVVLQGIDTAGKDGTIRGVFNATGPLGVVVAPFGRPSDEELTHDYLW